MDDADAYKTPKHVIEINMAFFLQLEPRSTPSML